MEFFHSKTDLIETQIKVAISALADLGVPESVARCIVTKIFNDGREYGVEATERQVAEFSRHQILAYHDAVKIRHGFTHETYGLYPVIPPSPLHLKYDENRKSWKEEE